MSGGVGGSWGTELWKSVWRYGSIGGDCNCGVAASPYCKDLCVHECVYMRHMYTCVCTCLFTCVNRVLKAMVSTVPGSGETCKSVRSC